MGNKKLIMGILVITTIYGTVTAVPLAPGDNVVLSGTTVAANPDLAGLVLEDPITPFNNMDMFSGELQGRVVLSENLETIIFSPRMRDFNDLVSEEWALIAIEVHGYAGWSTNVDYRLDGLGDVGPGAASRSVDGNVITFDFSADPVEDGNETYFLSVLTNAPAYIPIEDGITLTFSDSNGVQETVTLDYFMPAEQIELGFDIKPGSCPNPVNIKSKGVLPAAILGSETFDVNQIDVTTIELAGVSPVRSSFGDVATLLVDANECECTTDSNDGFTDLTLKFDTQEIVEAIGPVADGEELVLEVTGFLNNGIPFIGEDCIVIRAKGKNNSD